jgi:hypothetical protein
MPNKKHYWTQVFLVTTLVSCGLGLVSGFRFGLFYKPCIKAETREGAIPILIPTHPSINPLVQPGAIAITPEPTAPIVIKEPQYSRTGAVTSNCHFDMSHWRPDPKDPGMHSATLAKHKLKYGQLPRPMVWPSIESLTKRPN